MSLWRLSLRITTKSVCECVHVCVCEVSWEAYRLLKSSFFLVQSIGGALLLERFWWASSLTCCRDRLSAGMASEIKPWAIKNGEKQKKWRLSTCFIKNIHPSLFDSFPWTATFFINIIYHTEEQSFHFQCNMFYLCFRVFPVTYLRWGVCRRGCERGVGRGIGWRWTDWQLWVPLRLFGPSTVHLETETAHQHHFFQKKKKQHQIYKQHHENFAMKTELRLGKIYSFFFQPWCGTRPYHRGAALHLSWIFI